MKKLLYISILFFFVLNASAKRVMLAEGEIIVLDSTSSDIMPVKKKEAISQEEQSNITSNTTPDDIQANQSETDQDEQSGYSQGSVTRSVFTSQVTEHEPTDKLEKIPSINRSVTYFTELRDMSGQTAIHRWEFNGKVMAETKFNIAGPRWRVWSSKNLLPSWTGEWKVSVLNGLGDVISEDVFSYVEEDVPEAKNQQMNEPGTQEVNSNPDKSSSNDNLNQ